MGRTNLDPIMTFPDGSHLLISTAYSKEGNFSCALYMATIAADDRGTFRVVSNHLAAATCCGCARRRLQLCPTSLPTIS